LPTMLKGQRIAASHKTHYLSYHQA